MEYISFDEAIALVAASGQGSTLIKRDLADAFRYIPVAPQDHWLLGFSWNEQYWLVCFLPFGLRTSPYLFNLFAKGIQFVAEANDHIHASFSAVHYLDDFLGIARPGVNPTIYEHRFQAACNALGFQIKHSKSVTGTTVQFHGLEIDTLAMQARLPPEKLDKAQSLVQHFSRRRSIHLAELQSLLGYLSFCAKVIPIGRSFLHRLFDATRGGHGYANSPSHPCPPPNSRPRSPPNSRPRPPPNPLTFQRHSRQTFPKTHPKIKHAHRPFYFSACDALCCAEIPPFSRSKTPTTEPWSEHTFRDTTIMLDDVKPSVTLSTGEHHRTDLI